ncbi:MAG: histidine--tRNA ligase [Candidatus Micrarchaeaceae archaeon]|jgi:histidyl-tRNA synthetase
MAEIPFPRGVRDLMPNEALFRNELLNRIENLFQLFGFLTIDTPSFESLQVLNAKNAIGEDTKLIYELKNDNLGLRYDNTVSLARYISMHQELPLPFKRYYIGKVWRREEPQHLRYRELTQADVDIIGGNPAMADAEIIGVGGMTLDSIGIEYVVQINNRELLEKVLLKFGVKDEKFMGVARALDKLEKIGEEKVVELLRGLELDNSSIDQIMAFITLKGINEEKLSYVDSLLGNKESTKELRETLSFIEDYKIRGDVQIDFSIMRGLDYYTGIVFEYKNKEDTSASVCGGGRYDKLIALYGGKQLPAVGLAFGIDRILEMLNFSSSIEYTYANVFVANVNENNYPYALKVANVLRANGIPTEINLALRNLSNQFAYANAIKTKYVIIIGDVEEKLGNVKLRNLISGTESSLHIDQAIKTIKGE